MVQKKKILVVQVAALSWHVLKNNDAVNIGGLDFKFINPVFPAVTCTAQATFRTASSPACHGMVANGLFNKTLNKVLFWEQSAHLVKGRRIWEEFRKDGNSVGLMFWQQILGEDADFIMSPAPIHKHHGGMIQDCYSMPAEIYPLLMHRLKPFNLMNYWGPLASPASSQWIADATCSLLDQQKAPDLLFTYLPALDYDFQRFGPDSSKSVNSIKAVLNQIEQLVDAAKRNDYEILIFGDYAIVPCKKGAVHVNKALYESGFLNMREIRGRLYHDLYTSRAFAVADHEIAHIHVADNNDIAAVSQLLRGLPGVESVMDKSDQKKAGVESDNTGDLLAVAEDGYWMSYKWWGQKSHAPDYASHVDIHSKPGFDPCELFFGWPPGAISLDDSRVSGTHGKIGPGREVAWASSFIDADVSNLIELAGTLQEWMING